MKHETPHIYIYLAVALFEQIIYIEWMVFVIYICIAFSGTPVACYLLSF